MDIHYIAEPHVHIAKKAGQSATATGSITKLLGARVHIELTAAQNGWVPVSDMPDEHGRCHKGFIELSRISPLKQLKVFYVDVGQGDATLIEAEQAIVIIDCGPNKSFLNFLNKRLSALRRADTAAGLPQRAQLFIDAVFISHFDKDHYQGLVSILKHPDFKIGSIYHNGLPRYASGADKDLDLGSLITHNDGSRSISTDFSSINAARNLVQTDDFKTAKNNNNGFCKFMLALLAAHDDGRLNTMQALRVRDTNAIETINIGPDLQFQLLAPVSTQANGDIRLPCFPDPHNVSLSNPQPAPNSSHTINGNSIVLRLLYKNVSFLFGGDLNQPAQRYLRQKYGDLSLFQSDINKACHHGSSDFDLAYLKDVRPQATVFSSGDNGNYDHPLPDAIGAAAKHSAGDYPLIFSTELARDNLSSGKVKLGHINARSNGDTIVMAQKKESPSAKKPWHTFPVPFAGPFEQHS